MKNAVSQHGVGLVEVLVAVLLLSVTVLGFSALQIRAVSATDESLVRTRSMTLVRNLAEIMRAYPDAYVISSGSGFESVAPNAANIVPVPTVQAIITSPATNSVTVDTVAISISSTNCVSTPCNINQQVARDTLLVKKTALEEDIEVAVVTCPGTASGTLSTQLLQQQMCVITAWKDTKALLDDTDDEACADNNGVYKTGSHCLISEAY